jgi:hypothetical protein
MYAPVPTTTDGVLVPPARDPLLSPRTQRWLWNMALVAALTGALFLTYDRCITCVLAITVLSLLSLNCVSGMPLVFALSLGVLLIHAIDYNHASVKVEIPLGDIVYIPTYDDIERYVHVLPASSSASAAAAMPLSAPPASSSSSSSTATTMNQRMPVNVFQHPP